ncbi:phosphate ABC transporter substrate-binding protein PstS [Gardnerella sp. DNF01198P]|uniref:phosphate ABC transporter substrate-binding protein PstS n=1 Tax=Gardnerella sp. DNF01198P TaxID=2749066 RepID=UPI003BAC3824
MWWGARQFFAKGKKNMRNDMNKSNMNKFNTTKSALKFRSIAAAALTFGLCATCAACGDNVPADNSNASGSQNTKISGNFQGSGASSQQVAMEAWIAGFQSKNPGAKIAYNPTGSGAGVTTFMTGATAWAGSDKALSNDEVEKSKSVCAHGTTAFDVPVYVSPIAIIFNLKGVSDAGKHINLDASTIAKIFDGKITRWNDDDIKKQNPKLKLPDTPITVVHRSDKSGTTQNFLSYVKDAAPDDWKYDLSENWPNSVGQGAKGTSGVVSTIRMANGAIGYADFSQVGKLGTVAVKVGDTYNEISPEAASQTLADSEIDADASAKYPNRVVMKINHNTQSKGAYPIVLVSYDIACPVYKDAGTARFVKSWLSYVTSVEGQNAASSAAGTAPLPQNLVSKINASIKSVKTGK